MFYTQSEATRRVGYVRPAPNLHCIALHHVDARLTRSGS